SRPTRTAKAVAPTFFLDPPPWPERLIGGPARTAAPVGGGVVRWWGVEGVTLCFTTSPPHHPTTSPFPAGVAFCGMSTRRPEGKASGTARRPRTTPQFHSAAPTGKEEPFAKVRLSVKSATQAQTAQAAHLEQPSPWAVLLPAAGSPCPARRRGLFWASFPG